MHGTAVHLFFNQSTHLGVFLYEKSPLVHRLAGMIEMY